MVRIKLLNPQHHIALEGDGEFESLIKSMIAEKPLCFKTTQENGAAFICTDFIKVQAPGLGLEFCLWEGCQITIE